jgi:deazaflavin-dependent oxidoreductase (nitroreductase family)
MSLLLLTTSGARTGRRRATPLTYLADDGRYIVAAANAGAPANPDWYRNLIANPEVTIETGGETFSAAAAVVTGTQRDALFSRYVAAYPQLVHYQALAQREIPLVALT